MTHRDESRSMPPVGAPPVQPDWFIGSPPVGASAIALDARGYLSDDTPCRSCGYSLRGLAMAGACPECGTAVGRSVFGDMLRYSDPKWVEKVAQGANLLVWSIGAQVAATAMLIFASILLMPGTGLNSTALVIVAAVIFLPVSVLQILACWKLTSPDPARDETARPMNARTLARFALCGAVILGLALMPMAMGARAAPAAGAPLSIIAFVLSTIQGIVGLVGLAALFVYASSLARRIPDDKLARRTRIVMWWLVSTLAIYQAFALAMMHFGSAILAGNPANMTGIMLMTAGSCAIGVTVLAFAIWAVVLCFQYRNRFMKAAKEARATWAAATPAAPARGE